MQKSTQIPTFDVSRDTKNSKKSQQSGVIQRQNQVDQGSATCQMNISGLVIGGIPQVMDHQCCAISELSLSVRYYFILKTKIYVEGILPTKLCIYQFTPTNNKQETVCSQLEYFKHVMFIFIVNKNIQILNAFCWQN